MRNKVIAIVTVVAILAVTAFFAQGYKPVAAQGTPTPATGDTVTRTVSVSGNGVATAAPDQATIYVGVRTEGTTSAEALEENNSQMTALINTLKGAGIAARDIKTTDFSIHPRYADTRDNSELRIIGYEVSNSVQVTVRDLENIGATLDAAVSAGSNQISGISFGFNDPAALVEQAREQAMANARANAAQLAELADVELGMVVSISEGVNNTPTPVFRGEVAMDTASSVPIESGESAVNVIVNVTYELIVP